MKNYQQGQILLIVVLVMVTALSVGLSVAARSITDTRTSLDSSNSEKAFTAAEAGIESLIAKGSLSPKTVGTFVNNNTSYIATSSAVTGTNFMLNNGAPVLKDNSVDLWLSTYPSYTGQKSGFITFYWGTSTDPCADAALELIVLSGSATTPLMTKYAVDPCVPRITHNRFSSVGVGGVGFNYSTQVNVTNGLFIRVIPLYTSATLAVRGLCNNVGGACISFPSQGTVIQSVGTAQTTERKLVTYTYYPKLPTELLQYSLFAP